MKEVFYEETCFAVQSESKKKKIILFKILSLGCYVVSFLLLLILYYMVQYLTLLNGLIVFTPPTIFLVMGIIINKLKDRLLVEYDYTFVTGSIRFSKVFNNVKRKNIISFDCTEIEKIGRYNSPVCNKYFLLDSVKKFFLTSNDEPAEDKGRFYIVTSKNTQKYIFILECTNEFLIHILRSTKSHAIEEGII